jgi:hypothetical protein
MTLKKFTELFICICNHATSVGHIFFVYGSMRKMSHCTRTARRIIKTPVLVIKLFLFRIKEEAATQLFEYREEVDSAFLFSFFCFLSSQ